MSKSAGITLTAAGIAAGNEWLQTKQIPWRIGIAGLIATFLFDGIEKLNEKAGVVLSVAMLITVLVTPIKGNSPAQELYVLVNNPSLPTGIKRHPVARRG